MPGHSIQVLTFDADGTIWDLQTTMRESLTTSLSELKALFPDATAHLTVDDLLTHRQEAEAAFQGQSMTLEGLRFAGFMRSLDAIGIRDEPLARRLASEYMERRFAHARLFDDVLPALDLLKHDFRLGLLTNGNSYPDNLKLHDRFELTLVAQEYDLWKPDIAFYERAIDEFGVPANQILHIGDSLENDVRPARRAGMQVVWLNRRGDEAPAFQQSVATLYSLQELPTFLGLTGG